jgi:peptide subunit release factor 1 (eRF1)
LEWIAEDLAKLNAELEVIGKTFDEQDEVGDPFAGLEVK